MPIYEFVCTNDRCPRQGQTFDVRLPIADRDTAEIGCPDCAGASDRQVIPSEPPTCVITKPLNLGGHTKERLLP